MAVGNFIAEISKLVTEPAAGGLTVTSKNVNLITLNYTYYLFPYFWYNAS
jgi:hypothetical protein